MTEDDKQLVRDSWAKVIPISDKAAELFYNRLFELDSSLRPLFTSDITEQGRKLMGMITVAVKGLDRLEEIIPAVRALGKRHSGYGVTDDHYDTVATGFGTFYDGIAHVLTDKNPVKQPIQDVSSVSLALISILGFSSARSSMLLKVGKDSGKKHTDRRIKPRLVIIKALGVVPTAPAFDWD